MQRKAGALQRVFFPFGTRVCSAKRVHLSGWSYHLARVCAALSGCTSAGVLTIWHACVCVCAAQSGCTSGGVVTIWHACVQRTAGALQRVFLPFGMRVCSAERMHLSGCSRHVACVCAVLSGCTSAGVLSSGHACVQRKAGALQRVFLLFGMRVCSAERMHFSGCSYHSACVCAAQSGCTSAGVLTIWHACVQC